MTARWGVFLCNCQHTLELEPQLFDLPARHIQFAAHTDSDLKAFSDLVSRERCTHALIACRDKPSRFEDVLRPTAGASLRTHFIDLRGTCFAVHDDPREAQLKAARLLRGTLRAAEAQAEPSYVPLQSNGRVLIAANEPLAGDLARRLSGDCRPILLLDPHAPAIESPPSWRVYRGELLEVSGRLGNFHALVDLPDGNDRNSRSIR